MPSVAPYIGTHHAEIMDPMLETAQKEAQRLVAAAMHKNSASIVTLIDAIMLHAYAAGVSDVHILPGRTCIDIRFRIDGILEEAHKLPFAIHAELVSRLKILSNVRTDEHTIAHDGRFRFVLDSEHAIDIRIAFAPTYYGEKAVLRLLSLANNLSTFDELGLSSVHASLLEKALSNPHGMILATGPTGSGKTTTLYTLVTSPQLQGRAIVTIEDPIEYSIDNISQIPVNPRSGFTFAQGLRSVLRQDPDVIMVGEIRDTETAQLACNAALTGHLILSSLHTSDAATALVRLRDLGIEPYLIASGISVIISQRLMRRVCTYCSEPSILNAFEQEALCVLQEEGLYGHERPSTFMRGTGCLQCNGSGFRGRVGAYEVLVADDQLRADLGECSSHELTARIRARGGRLLLHDALGKSASGITTLDEALRLRRI